MNYFHLYQDFLLKNASQITSIESSLRSLTYILPGRFHDAELASQALYAALNLIGLYHTSILKKAAQESKTKVEETAFNKYLDFWSSQSSLNNIASKLLSIITYTQVLMEMAVLKKLGKRQQWQLITVLEALKVVLKLTLFQTTSHRMTLYPPHLERDVDPAALATLPKQHQQQQEGWVGKRTGVAVPSLSSSIDLNRGLSNKNAHTDVTDYLMSKVLTPEKLRKPTQMVQVQKHISQLGELLYIIRPLLYVLSMLRFGKRSWKPWVLSLLIESFSQWAVRKGYENKGSRNQMLTLEQQEFNRRLKLMLLNIMRGAFYLKITRPRLEKFCNKTESKPILSMVSGVLRDYLPLWEQIYFYTSAS
ncbi:peroxisome membrane protein [Gilbertella persicaria]|uniref:peroxisome membrane protein n=1 Tax=Gilbertella persicaria TaxID=101096 RepID=UPI002220B1D9|nr:peroxisome membrane protein [Gilbertella persicaria]KAI8075443.1 peroxisome membrane protein [Gilbertella persicaria]